jgi:hypothetical protein
MYIYMYTYSYTHIFKYMSISIYIYIQAGANGPANTCAHKQEGLGSLRGVMWVHLGLPGTIRFQARLPCQFPPSFSRQVCPSCFSFSHLGPLACMFPRLPNTVVPPLTLLRTSLVGEGPKVACCGNLRLVHLPLLAEGSLFIDFACCCV